MTSTPPPADDLKVQLQSAFDDAAALDDPDILRAIDEEFAELTQEINRINSLPIGQVRETNIEALREHWRRRSRERVNLPPWRRRLDEALEQAFERMLVESRDRAPSGDGPLSLQLDGDAMMRHGAPVISALIEGLQVALNQKLSSLGNAVSIVATQATQAVTQAAAASKTPAASTTPPAPPPDASPTQAPPAGKAQIQVNVDLQGLLGSLLKQLKPADQGKPPAKKK